jgi:methionyl-tRNA formyltransferase
MTIKTVFFGSSSFSLPFLQCCREQSEVCHVITLPDTIKNRGKKLVPNIVKETSLKKDLSVLTPSNLLDPKFLNILSKSQASLFVTASYGKILPKQLLQIPTFFSINIHPSLLPNYRGADPLFWQIVHQVEQSGVSIFQMLPSLDNGPILKQKAFPLLNSDTYQSLEQKTTKWGVLLLSELLDDLKNKRYISSSEQHPHCPFYARKRTSLDEQIHWNTEAKRILALIRAFPPDIGAFTWFGDKRIKILQANLGSIALPHDYFPGQISILDKKVYAACQDALIQIQTVKIEGKSKMSDKDFLNGYLLKLSQPFFHD